MQEYLEATMSIPIDSSAPQAVQIGALGLEGNLSIPDAPKGLVIFAHGSGSSRLSPRNKAVARALTASGFGTLLFDLLTPLEAENRNNVFDIALLAERVIETVTWARESSRTGPLPVGLFGASTGAAAALVAGGERPRDIAAVVSRVGRPDLAATHLTKVQAPTLLIVGGADSVVRELNASAFRGLACEERLHIVAGATHLFEEPGALEEVVQEATAWFEAHFSHCRKVNSK